MRKLIVLAVVLLSSCNLSSNRAAVAFLWNEEPTASSTEIMVVSDIEEAELRSAAIQSLNNIGFVVEEVNEDEIITEPKGFKANLMRMLIQVNNNVLIISGEQGSQTKNNKIEWKQIERGEENAQDAYASPEWELMNVLASSVSHKTILYN